MNPSAASSSSSNNNLLNSNPTISPMKGIDRFSEEIKIERSKNSSLLQTQAKLKIEIENLKLIQEKLKTEKEDLINENFNLKRSLQEERVSKESLQSQFTYQQQNLIAHEKEKQELETLIHKQDEEMNLYQELMNQQKEELLNYHYKIENYEKKMNSKDELINSLKLELVNIRQLQLKSEKDSINSINELNSKTLQEEEMLNKIQLIKELEENLNATKENNELIYVELNKSIELNQMYQQQIEDLQTKLLEKNNKEKEYFTSIDSLMNTKEIQYRELNNYEENLKEIMQTLALEKESNALLKERNQSLQQNQQFLENQMKEIKELYENTLKSNLLLEENYSRIKILNNTQQEEIMDSKEKIKEMELLINQMTSNESMKNEIEMLKNQLQIMRKKLIQKGLEEESSTLTSKQMLDREQQGRQVRLLFFLPYSQFFLLYEFE